MFATRRTFVVMALTLLCCFYPDEIMEPPVAPDISEGYLDTGTGIRLFYRAVGSGKETIVVVHGGPGFSMEYLFTDLAPIGRQQRVIFYDQRGSGRSTLVSDTDGLDALRFVDDLESLRKHFGLDRMTLLGHSWGAALAALYGEHHPEHVARLLIVGGVPLRRIELDQAFERINSERSENERERLLAAKAAWTADRGDADACRAYYGIWYSPFVADRTVLARSQGDFCAGGPEALRNKSNVDAYTLASLGDYDLRTSVSTITAPTLIVHGTSDVFPLGSAREWAAALPNARLLALEGVGHFPYLEAPDLFFPAVDRFLRGGWPDEARGPGDE